VLLQRVVGLKLPGFGRLLVAALGEATSWQLLQWSVHLTVVL
jgi:hypothetical protein